MRICRAVGCTAPTASRYSPHCSFHKSRVRRQGHAEQTVIKIGELAPYVKLVKHRIAKNPDSPLWPHTADLWSAIVDEAREDAAREVQSRYDREAANTIIGLSLDTKALDIFTVTAAMFILASDWPSRFETDTAFRVQTAKRVLGLSWVGTGLKYDYRKDKQVRVYGSNNPKALAIIGAKLSRAFGALGLQLAKLEERDRQRKEEKAEAVRQALQELQ